ncbi:MAG: hypothetical protein VR69_17005 [Peptococcaceae bacterium BRH_c4b]|nr:MAG: hypothetical protein VR69_17005 [Peptococcaceae bacterium BRH_c4b]
MIYNLSSREKILLSAFMIVLLVTGFFHFFGLPAYWRYVNSGEELRDIINDEQKMQAEEDRIQRELAQLGRAGANWKILCKKYKTGVDRGEFVVYLGTLAGSKIKINEIRSNPVVRQNGIFIQPYSIEFNGDYENIIETIKSLEKGDYCVDVKNIKFELPEGDIAVGVENKNAVGENISTAGESIRSQARRSITRNSVLAGIVLEVYFLPD